MLGRVFIGSGKSIDNGPSVLAEDFLDIQGGGFILVNIYMFIKKKYFINQDIWIMKYFFFKHIYLPE